LKIRDASALRLSSYKGNLFENFVISEYVKKNYHHNLLRDLWFWRDAVGHEVDLIWQEDEMLNLVEIKASETVMSDMFKGLTYFQKLSPELVKSKTLVHTGLFNQERNQVKVRTWKEIEL
jgi:predicted AAA+ superfamily ATPase